MPGIIVSEIRDRIGRERERFQRLVRPHGRTVLVIVVAIVAGGFLAGVASRIDAGERVVIGNTGGTLTTMLELSGARILVGAGPSRSHAADLIGRSTRPWDRQIDLLVLPGWDHRHVPGALGLIERGVIDGIAVIGIPGDEPSWTILEREAEQRELPVIHLNRPAQVRLGDHSSLSFSTSAGSSSDGAWIRLEHNGKLFDIVDSDESDSAEPDPRALPPGGEHIFINTRNQGSPEDPAPELLVMPAPHWQHDFGEIASPYSLAISRNEHEVITLTDDAFRLSLDSAEVGD